MDPKSIRLDQAVQHAAESMAENGQADNASDAIRKASRKGFRQMGYLDGAPRIVMWFRVAWSLLLIETAVGIGYLILTDSMSVAIVAFGLAMATLIAALAEGAIRLYAQHSWRQTTMADGKAGSDA